MTGYLSHGGKPRTDRKVPRHPCGPAMPGRMPQGSDRTTRTANRIALLLPVMLLAVLLSAGSADALTPFINAAQLSSSGGVIATAAVTAYRDAPTPSAISFFQYAPSAPGATGVMVPIVYNGGTPLEVFAVGSPTPIDMSVPVPLLAAVTYHQNEPVFIQVNDGDQDQDPTTAETVWVLVSVPAIGESELMLLTETGPNTGAFMGYIQSTGVGAAVASNGVLTVTAAQPVVGEYVDSGDNTDRSSASVLVDPYGVVFDSGSGSPLNGVGLTLIDAATGLPATVYGDDGISSFPATLTSGGTVTDSSGRIYVFPAGGFRFPFVAPGDYRIVIAPPAGYGAPSTVPTAVLQALPGGPFAILEPGSREEVFTINPGPSVNLPT